jgi:hypothetical protein
LGHVCEVYSVAAPLPCRAQLLRLFHLMLSYQYHDLDIAWVLTSKPLTSGSSILRLRPCVVRTKYTPHRCPGIPSREKHYGQSASPLRFGNWSTLGLASRPSSLSLHMFLIPSLACSGFTPISLPSLSFSHLHGTLASFAACFLPRGLLSLLLVWCWQFRSGGTTLDTWRRLKRLGRVDLAPEPPASEKGEEALVGLGVGNQDARQVYVLAHLVAHDPPRRQRIPGIHVPDPEQFWRKESHTCAIPQHGPKHRHAQDDENLLPEAV